MKVGNLPEGTLILHGIGVSGSSIFSTWLILSCLTVRGGNPDCRMTVKNAFSRSEGHCPVISLISSFVISLFVKFFLTPLNLVACSDIKGVGMFIYLLRSLCV